MRNSVPVSVCMPMYNAAPYLRECIDSILSQSFEDFELLIVDDGSTDNSRDIVCSYEDERIRLIENGHDYIGSLNMLLKEAKGKYIARMDADDVMMPYRLKAQFGYMEKHTEVGVLGGWMQQIGKRHGTIRPICKITMQDMINSCCIAHPSVMIRTSVLRKHGLQYEESYKYAEDYRLWMQMLKHSIIFRNLNAIVIKYRISEGQISIRNLEVQAEKTNKIKSDGAKWLLEKTDKVSHEELDIPVSENLLTVVIPFLNEQDEVKNTVRSIRNTAGKNVDIIVVNDDSDDGYDYESDLKEYHVIYVHNKYRIGAAASKEKGARLSRTPYFLLLDAHMRCFTVDWHETIIAELQNNDRQILCCQTTALGKDKHQIVFDKKVAPTDGAYILFDYNNYIPGIHWIEYERHGRLPGNQIACILGAAYASSKRYWSLIKGLEGLMHYGSEETYLSLKAWLEGGGCSLLPDVVFGHIYRAAPPYRIVTAQMHYNLFVISATLFPTSLQCWSNAIAYDIDKLIYEEIQFWISMNKHSLMRLKKYYSETFHGDFEDVLDLNNIIVSEKVAMAEYERKRIPSLLHYLRESSRTASYIDLWDGCTGLLIALCEYDEYEHDEANSALANELLRRLSAGINSDFEIPVSFCHGACGIGWGLIYMIRNGLADIDFTHELYLIDRKVMEINPGRVTNFSFGSGIGGVFCYVANRLYFSQTQGEDCPYDKEFLSSLKAAAGKALNKTSDLRTRSYALLLLSHGQDDWRVLCPQWKDVIDLPDFLPESMENWEKGLTGAAGYFCHLIQILRSTRPNEKIQDFKPCCN